MILLSRLDGRSAVGVCAMLAILGGCNGVSSPVAKIRGSADGTLAQSSDGAFLYAVSADDNTLVVVDAQKKTLLASIPVGQAPARVVVGPDDTIYVSNRGSRTVSVIHKGAWTEAGRIAVGAEPVGLAVASDGSMLYVANFAAGTVSGIDLSGGTPTAKWPAVFVGDFPRGVGALPDGRVYVSHYRSGLVDVLDGRSGKILKSISTAVGAVPALTLGQTAQGSSVQPTFKPTAIDSIVVSHDGKRAYLPHRRDRSGLISDTNFAPIVAPALTTIELASDQPHDDAVETSADYPPTIVFPDNQNSTAVLTQGVGAPGLPSAPGNNNPINNNFPATNGGGSGGGSSYGGEVAVSPSGVPQPWTQGPVAVVEDPQGAFLYVANENSGNVTVLPTHRRQGADAPGGIVSTIAVGDGPTGLALSVDQKSLFVYNSLAHSVSVVTSVGGVLQESSRIEGVGTPGSLTVDQAEGRRLFFTASDPVMSAPGSGVSCESCHVDGSHDGNTWQFVQGPRKTPGLIGKHVKETAPYHWDGTESGLHSLMTDTITVRMGGSGVTSSQEQQVMAFMEQLVPLDNPQLVAGGLTASQQHGQQVAQASGCLACHSASSAELTDNAFHDVGTRVDSNLNGNADDRCRLNAAMGACVSDSPLLTPTAFPSNVSGGFNTPTLLGLYYSGPYLHDGSAQTLADIVSLNNAQGGGVAHGNTKNLSSQDVQDLVAYLQSL